MAQRKKTPDILGDLLGSKPIVNEPVEAPVKQQNVLPVKQQDGEAVSHETGKTLSQQDVLPVQQQNGKTSNRQNVLPVNQQNGETVSLQDALPVELQNGITVRRQNVISAKPQAGKTVSQQDVLPVKHQNSKPVGEAEPDTNESEMAEVEAKTKMTFYLSEDSVELLEEAQRKLRRMAKKAGKVQPKGITSKSALLEEALKLACDDLETNGDKSRFASLIA